MPQAVSVAAAGLFHVDILAVLAVLHHMAMVTVPLTGTGNSAGDSLHQAHCPPAAISLG
jgi:hypothetical protein